MSISLVHPVPGAHMTDRFGYRGAIPGVVAAQLHTGQDFAADTGTPVYAAHAGRVNAVWYDQFSNGDPAGGNMLKIGSAQFSTRYAHLSGYAVGLGEHVEAGQLIGYVGSSGAATGPHLHFELQLPGGNYVDPVPYMTTPFDRLVEKIKKGHTVLIKDENSSVYIVDGMGADHLGDIRPSEDWPETSYAATTLYGSIITVNNRQRDLLLTLARRRWARASADIAKAARARA